MSEWFEIFPITAFHHLPLLPGIVKANLKPLHFFAKLVMKNSSCFLAAYKTTGKKNCCLSYCYCCTKHSVFQWRWISSFLYSGGRSRMPNFWDYLVYFARWNPKNFPVDLFRFFLSGKCTSPTFSIYHLRNHKRKKKRNINMSSSSFTSWLEGCCGWRKGSEKGEKKKWPSEVV